MYTIARAIRKSAAILVANIPFSTAYIIALRSSGVNLVPLTRLPLISSPNQRILDIREQNKKVVLGVNAEKRAKITSVSTDFLTSI